MQQSNSARSTRYIGRAALRSITTVLRCYDCGREPHGQAVEVRRTAEGVVGFAGLVSCGRVWLCPVCNAKVMAKRAIEIGCALLWAQLQGFHVIWGSLTCRHNAQSDLSELLEIQRAAWRFVVSDRRWRSSSSTVTVAHQHTSSCGEDCDRKRDIHDTGMPGRVGYIRAAELTIGGNGWHPHFHPIILVRGTKAEAKAIAAEVVQLWVHGVEAAGGEARGFGAQQLRVLSGVEVHDELAGYVTKATYEAAAFQPDKLALETVWSQGKTGRGRAKSTASHWSLLAGIAQGLADEAGRWAELETATAGHRMLMWSRGLRTFAGLGAEVSDEDEAAREVGTREDSVCFITGDGWRSIRDAPELLALMLDVLESGGWDGLRVLLDAHSVEYFQLQPASEI